MKKHICEYRPFCTCYQLADEPSESCEIHGIGPARWRCNTCGRFIKKPKEKADRVK